MSSTRSMGVAGSTSAPGGRIRQRPTAGRAELFSLALRHGPVTRGQLAEWTGLDPSTVTRALRPLIEDDYLHESGQTAVGRGRPGSALAVNPARHVAVGVKVGPTAVSGALSDLGGRVLARRTEALGSTEPAEALEVVASVVEGLITASGAERADVLGVGVGLGGHVDPAAGTCRFSAILRWRDVAVRDPLTAALGLPVFVENDVDTLALAEHWFGRGRGVSTFAVVTLGVGIGCGLVLGDRLHTGARGIAGELGHLPLDPAGRLCSCGAQGCLEALAGDAAICELSGCSSVDEALRAAGGQGDSATRARDAFHRAGDALGRGLAGLCNLVDPELVIIAGESAAAFTVMEPAVRQALALHGFSGVASELRIEVDADQEDLWTRGAATVAIQAGVGRL